MPRRARTWRRLSVVLLCLATGCARGPDEETLRADLQARLDAGFEDGLFAIRSFRRTGSAPFRDPEDGSSGAYVYYDAELEFLRDYSLTSWRGLNLGTLAFALGATERGVEGFDAGGNRKGDFLAVYGRLSYARSGDGWEGLDDVVPAATGEGAPVTVEGAGPSAVLRSVRSLAERVPQPSRDTREGVIVSELGRASERIDLRFAELDGLWTFGSGPPSGTYRAFGTAFAEYAKGQGVPVHDHPTEGSVENGFSVQSTRLDFALIQSDVAEILFTGWTEQAQVAQPNLRAMASLWPEALHVVTLEGSGIERLADLRGRSIAVGQPGSGTNFTAIRVAVAAGLQHAEFAGVRQLALADSLQDLEAGEVDAVLAIEAVPSLALQALARRRRDVRFVSVDRDAVRRLSEGYFAYYPLSVPARSYPGQTEPFHTVGMAAVLITNRVTPDERVERVLALVLDGADALSKVFYRAGFISKETARLGIALPLHPAAARLYEERERAAQSEAAPPP